MLEKLQDKNFVAGIVAAIVAILSGLFGVQIFDEATIALIVTAVCSIAALIAFVKQTIAKANAQSENVELKEKLQVANTRLTKVGMKEV